MSGFIVLQLVIQKHWLLASATHTGIPWLSVYDWLQYYFGHTHKLHYQIDWIESLTCSHSKTGHFCSDETRSNRQQYLPHFCSPRMNVTMVKHRRAGKQKQTQPLPHTSLPCNSSITSVYSIEQTISAVNAQSSRGT